MAQKENIQERFLNVVRKSKTSLTLYLISGVKLQGTVAAFDNFCILLRRNGQSQLVYKHAIATILPGESVNLQFDNDENTDNSDNSGSDAENEQETKKDEK